MSDPNIEPLHDELAALLVVERRAEAPRESLDRVWSKLAVSIPSGPGGGGHGPPAGGTGGGVIGPFGAKALATLGVVFGGGAIAVAVASARRIEHPTSHIAPVETHVAAPTASVVTAMATNSVEPPVVESRHIAPPRAHASASAAPAQIDRERAVLDEARDALRKHDGVTALTAVDRHAREFVQPALGEEREALAVQALVISGRYDEARGRAALFRAASPKSLFLPAVDASLASIP